MSDENRFDPNVTRRELMAGAVAAGVAASVPAGLAFADEAAPAAVPAVGGSAVEMGVKLIVNGQPHALSIDPRATLLDTLRETLSLTGTKKGCDHGQCGACTVHVNGERALSCLMLAAQCEGDQITTIEGIANGDELHPVQKAFIDHDGFQCGYCTSGQIMSAVALIKEGHATTEDEVRELMSGNLCRCGAYPNICKAVMDAQGKLAGSGI
ncbi:MAG TPA: (2Fe-2S)-binding protein [Tepidisphaeraceae bacterium]|nr:(2Fe-2S)-binding protein [Tepidisphaeraceae bacterium]